MAGFDFAFFQLLFKMVAHQTGSISRVDFEPQKPHFEGRAIAQAFPRATPESQGISSDHVRGYLEALADDPDSNPHHVMIMRHGYVIAECSFFPYVNGMWHVTHSMCKTITGMAVGFAIDEGLLSLDEHIMTIFSKYTNVLLRLRKNNVTIENLLDMTSGVDFSEAGAISGNSWRSGFMNAAQKFEPGTQFEYNSMNSYMLSAAIQEKTGMTMMEYLRPRLFDPLGIEEIFWEKCPQGVTKGGWGLFLKPEDALKLGWLYLNRGVWHGKQIVPESWVETSTSRHSDGGSFGYGYQLWMEERPGAFAYNGLFGQDIVVCPDIGLVHMVNASSRELIQSGDLTDIMRRFWGAGYKPSDGPLPEAPEAYARLIQTEMNLNDGIWESRESGHRGFWVYPVDRSGFLVDDLTRLLSGHNYRMEDGVIGLFPLICQVMHNNFTEGIKEIGFDTEDEKLVLVVKEGDTCHRMKVGFGRDNEITEIDLRGEPYAVSLHGRITSDETDRIALVLELSFLEECCSRTMHLFFSGKDLELRATEKPGDKVIMEALDYTGSSKITENKLLRNLVPEGTMNIMDQSIYYTVHPIDIGHLIEKEDEAKSSAAAARIESDEV